MNSRNGTEAMRIWNYPLLAAGLVMAAACFGSGADQATGPSSGDSAVAAGNGVLPAAEGLGPLEVVVTGLEISWFATNNPAEANGPTPAIPTLPYLTPSQSYKLRLAGKFPAEVANIEDGAVDKVVTDTGENLLQQQNGVMFGFALRQHALNDKLQSGRTFVVQLPLATPSAQATKIKELSGKVSYTILGPTKTMDLGLTEFKTGATGTALDAKIEAVADKSRDTLTLSLSGLPERFGNFKFYDARGAALAVHGERISVAKKKTNSFLFVRREGFPETGRIELEVIGASKHVQSPFKLENIPLYCRPDLPPGLVEPGRDEKSATPPASPKKLLRPAPEEWGLALTVTGINVLWFDFNKWIETKESRPAQSYYQNPYYTLNLMGQLAKPVSRLEGGTVEKAVTDTGESLIVAESARFYTQLFQSDEGAAAPPGGQMFTVQLKLAVPGAKATVLKELSGQVYFTAQGMKMESPFKLENVPLFGRPGKPGA